MKHLLYMPVLLFMRLYRELWIRVALYALLSVVVAIGAGLTRGLIPASLSQRVGPDAVMPVLTILASSMLAVTTFSLNVMVSAHRSATSNATPRLHRLLVGDTLTQSVLATFIGAFVYALSTIILFRASLYKEDVAVVIMGVTVLMVILVIIAMLRWIDHLSSLGSLDDAMRLTFDRTEAALKRLNQTPALGGTPMIPETIVPESVTRVPARRSGYVQIINMAELNDCAGESGTTYVLKRPGSFVLEGMPLAEVSGPLRQADIHHLSACFVIGDQRTDEQDPEFGLLTLSEISSKALSPGVNDPGTAIEVIAHLASLIWAYGQNRPTEAAPDYPRVFVAEPTAGELVEAGFAATARDGAAQIEVVTHLLDTLTDLTESQDAGLAGAARDMAERARAHAVRALTLDSEKARISTDQSFSSTTEPTE